ncbi:MAG: lasso peptide biosynthesis B2 protein [Gemmatimonadales bacterium]
MTSRLIRLTRLPAAERSVLLEAIVALIGAGLLLRLMTFKRLAPRLGRHMGESPERLDPGPAETAGRIQWAVETAARHLPWKPVCFPQAIAAKWMLGRRRIASTLYLGLDPNADYDAHAWVRAGALIVTGGPRRGHTIVSSFA